MKIIEIQNKAGKIRLADVVEQTVMDRLIGEIGKIFGSRAAASGDYSGELTNCAENAVDSLEIEIHSPGGSVMDGYTLYNEIQALRSRGVHVTATINSLAASMASVIAMAADVIRMVPNGRMMIHDVSTGIRGNAEDLRKQADLIDGMSNEIAQIYADRTGKPIEDMRGLMKTETWMSASVALKSGFIDEVFDIRAKSPTTAHMNVFARLFGNDADATQLDSIIEENATLNTALAAAQTKVAELTGLPVIIAEKDTEITNIIAERDAFKVDVDTLTAQLITSRAETEAAKASTGHLVTQTLATIGQTEPLELREKNESPTAGLTGLQKTIAAMRHKAAIQAAKKAAGN